MRDIKDARTRILDAAALVFARNPGATLDEVATVAGVGRATLHRHFAGRLDLQREVGVRGLAAIEAALGGLGLGRRPPREALEAMIDALVRVGEQLHFLLRTAELYEDETIGRAERRVDALVGAVLDRCARDGVLRDGLPRAWIEAALEALLYAAWTAVANGDLARNDAARVLTGTFLDGFGGRPRRAR